MYYTSLRRIGSVRRYVITQGRGKRAVVQSLHSRFTRSFRRKSDASIVCYWLNRQAREARVS